MLYCKKLVFVVLFVSGCANPTMQDKLSLFKANAFKSPSRCDSEFTKAQNARYKISAPFQVQYPISALRDKKEGFVNMEFDLSQDGIPININIIESYPERTFNRESERNLSRARYELKSAGISTNNTCLSVQLNYFLQDKT